MHNSELRWLTDAYSQTQKLRIMLGNQISAREREVDQGPAPKVIQGLYEQLYEAEHMMLKDFQSALIGHKAMIWLDQIKGVGPTLAAKILSQIDISNGFETVAKLWRYSGYGMHFDEDKQAFVRDRPTKGQKLPYNRRLKTTLYLVAVSFLKCKSPYTQFYVSAKQRYEHVHPEWTKAHIHNAALRKMIKMFLAHLWITWRTAEGLPTRAPYVQEYLHHENIVDPWKMVKKAKDEAA